MRSCVFLTMEDPAGFVFDDDLAVAPLRSLGWEVQNIPWTAKDVDWNTFEAVVPRTTWDYHHRLDQFLSVIEEIDRSSARLANGLPLIRWNSHKSYLLDLEMQGIRIVPTITGTSIERDTLDSLKKELGSDSIVIKPTVGANADFTYPIDNNTTGDRLDKVRDIYRDREFLAQRFMPGVITEGEFSLFYFNGEYSHTILKTPKKNDFRVQEEHGGIIQSVVPEERLMEAGRQTLQSLPTVPLYARPDFVRNASGEFALMELELIEPALYFRMDRESPHRFARALDQWMTTE